MRILIVIGTRPEAIKMLPLVKELQKYSEFEVLVCFSGQHETLAENVFNLFNIFPNYRFSGLEHTRTLNKMTVELLNYFDVLLNDISPDLVLVHGDTTTAFCAALSSFHLGIKVAHVEAGLRTFDNQSPFPEEFNRVAIDSLSSIHFAPTKKAMQNLLKEGKTSVFITGNTCIDSLKYTLSNTFCHPLLNNLNGKKLILITTHRRENLGNKMVSALLGIRDALEKRNDFLAITITHPNPIVKSTMLEIFQGINNIKISPPLDLFDFHNILSRSDLVISDSGGVQEEAAYLGIPLFLLRNTTERTECIECGNTKIIGTDREQIHNQLKQVLDNPSLLKNMRKKSLAFGDGNASKKIVKNLLSLV